MFSYLKKYYVIIFYMNYVRKTQYNIYFTNDSTLHIIQYKMQYI